MKIAYHKYVYINSFSFIKRFFLDPFTYGIITFIPLLSIPATVLSISGLTISLFLSTIAIVFSNYSIIYYLSPLFLLMIFKAQLYKIKFSDIVMKTRWLLIVSIIYAFIQIIFDFLPHEKMWIYSNLSIVKSPNVFVPGKSIRPFSIFASNPEFSLFCSIYLIEFIRKKNYFWIIISLVSLITAGSRGIMVSFFVAYIIVYMIEVKKRNIIIISLLLGVITYVLLLASSTFLYDISEGYNTSRLLVYGSFYARYEMVLEAMKDYSIYNVFFPYALTKLNIGIITYDNLFITLLFNFGLVGFFVFWKYFDFVYERKSLFFLSMLVVYGFFADTIYSFYLM